jgi:hypothetical protein
MLEALRVIVNGIQEQKERGMEYTTENVVGDPHSRAQDIAMVIETEIVKATDLRDTTTGAEAVVLHEGIVLHTMAAHQAEK